MMRTAGQDERASLNVSGTSSVYGVWGYPVKHSRSPAMHNAAFAEMGLNAVYVPFEVEPASIAAAIDGVRALGICGINITVPLKELAAACLPDLDPVSRRLGVVNTIVNREGNLTGYSTDGPGFMWAIKSLGWPASGQVVHILGAGGSARAVADSLAEAGNRLLIANRTRERAQDLAAQVNKHFPGQAEVVAWGTSVEPADLIVNTTSVGMHPNEGDCPPVDAELLRSRPRVYDLIYAPEETRLLSNAKQYGCDISNGLGMLVYQGALSLSLWLDRPVNTIPVLAMEHAVRNTIAAK